MMFIKKYCNACKKDQMFIHKLVDPMDGSNKDMEEVCTQCHTAYYVKPKLKLK